MLKFKINFLNENDIFVEKKTPRHKAFLPHRHKNVEFIYILSGKTTQYIDNIRYDASPGTMLISNADQIHHFTSESTLQYYIITVKPHILNEVLATQKELFQRNTDSLTFSSQKIICPCVRFSGELRKRTERIIEEMHREVNHPTSAEQMMILKNLLTVFFIYTLRCMESENQTKNNALNDITLYIEEQFRQKLTLDELAKKCGYSPKYFSQVFKTMFGITVTEYIQQKRINEACHLLLETDLAISEISRQVGYEDNTKFFHYFKKFTNTTPRGYRKENQ